MSEIISTGVLYGTLTPGGGTMNYNDLDNKPSINDVTLQGNKTAAELGLATPLDIKVQSVNGKTGAVVLNGSDIEYSSGVSVNSKIDAVESEIPVVDYPVTSVNSKTGDVVLTGSDIEYSSGVSVNSKINAVESEIPVVNYPVTSVNGKTGAVVLSADDILATESKSGNIVTFNTSITKPLVDCTTEAGATKVIKTSGNADIAACIRGLFLGTHKVIKLGDLSSSGWNYDSTNLRFYHSVGDAKANTVQRAYTSGCVLSNSYEPAFTTGEVVYATMITEIADMDNIYWLYTFQNGTQSIQFKDTDYTTIESFVNAVKDFYWIYELETPVTPTITPEKFTTLCTAFNIQGLITDLPLTDNPSTYAGSNNFFTDNGNISLTYTETIQDYIDNKTNSV